MNIKIFKEIFIVFLFLGFLLLVTRVEGMRNPLVLPEYEFSILTSPQEIMTGYNQEELCRNDPEWSSGDMKCHDILNKEDCILEGTNGVLANDACQIACDTCPSSVTIKQRQDVGDDFIARGINLEDSDEFDYLEIYDNISNINNNIDSIDEIFKEIRKFQGENLDLKNKCKPCFIADDLNTIYNLPNDGFLSDCPKECQNFANCFLDSDRSLTTECETTPSDNSTPDNPTPDDPTPPGDPTPPDNSTPPGDPTPPPDNMPQESE